MIKRGVVGLFILWFFWLAGSGPPVSAQTAAGPAMSPPSSGVPGKGPAIKEIPFPPQDQTVTIQIDKTQLNNGGTLKVSGTAPAGNRFIWKSTPRRRFGPTFLTTSGIRPPVRSLMSFI